MSLAAKKKWYLDYLLIIVGTGLMALAINSVFDASGLVTGGFSGIAILVKRWTGGIVDGGIPLWLTNITLNIPLFLLGCKIRGFSFVKTVLHPRQLLRRDGRAGIADRGDGFIPAALHADGERAAVIDELYRVFDKVVENLLHEVCVCDCDNSALAETLDIEVLVLDFFLEHENGLDNEVGEVCLAEIRRERARLKARHIQH